MPPTAYSVIPTKADPRHLIWFSLEFKFPSVKNVSPPPQRYHGVIPQPSLCRHRCPPLHCTICSLKRCSMSSLERWACSSRSNTTAIRLLPQGPRRNQDCPTSIYRFSFPSPQFLPVLFIVKNRIYNNNIDLLSFSLSPSSRLPSLTL